MTTAVKGLLLISVLVGVIACDERPGVSPVPSSPVSLPVAPHSTISGTVFEHTAAMSGGHPAAGVRLQVQVLGPNPYTAETVADAAGRYQFTTPGLLDGNSDVMVAPPPGSNYRAPCPPGTYGPNPNGPVIVLDLHVVSTAVLSTTGLPSSYPTASPVTTLQASGRVVSRSGPIAGASVEIYYSPFLLLSETLTDSNGAFLLCTPGQGGSDEGIDLRISKEGYKSAHRVLSFGWAETDMNVELLPQ